MPERIVIGWKLAALSLHIASVRYRGLLPILELDRRGIANRILSSGDTAQLEGLDCLVMVKSFTPDDLVLASEARRQGIPLVIDLCDNIFIDGYGSKDGVVSARPTLIFEQIARLAAVIVVTTRPLAEVVQSRIPGCHVVTVIPDGIETDDLVEKMSERLESALRERRGSSVQRSVKRLHSIWHKAGHLRTAEFGPVVRHVARLALGAVTRMAIRGRFLPSLRRKNACAQSSLQLPTGATTQGTHRRIVWFGHHGADYARFGMLDLLLVKDDLEAIARCFDVELVVISNNVGKYERHILPFAMRTRYVEWSNAALLHELDAADVVVIPNSLDAFSICKSSNRAVLALLNGVPVVATSTPALEALSQVIRLDNVRSGLATYLSDPVCCRDDVERGRKLIEQLYGAKVIGDLWSRVIDDARARGVPAMPPTEVAIVVQMALDWILLRPLVAEMKQRGRGIIAMLSSELQKDLAMISAELDALGVQMTTIAPAALAASVLPGDVRVLLAASESSLLPHRFAHELCRVANSKGILTATLQHGYETPGLTYHDPLQSARKIRFASQKVYLWGDRSCLCSQVPRATIRKCVSVGCPDVVGQNVAVESRREADDRRVIGIFENLHWHRYSDAYRQFFVEGILALSKDFPGVSFIVHTHPAGRWLDDPKRIALITLPNVTIARPGDEMRDVLPRLDAVISSPSSVVVHAARYGLPVAVVRPNIDASRYDGLFGIHTAEHWASYVSLAISGSGWKELVVRSQTFADHVMQPGDASSRIVDDLCRHI